MSTKNITVTPISNTKQAINTNRDTSPFIIIQKVSDYEPINSITRQPTHPTIIGKGGLGTVWLMRNRTSLSVYAIKQIPKSLLFGLHAY